jgi:hypothetical protein
MEKTMGVSMKEKERRKRNMALPITPTPVLRGKDAREFDRRIKEGLNKPTNLIATPNLEGARKLAIEYANRYKK